MLYLYSNVLFLPGFYTLMNLIPLPTSRLQNVHPLLCGSHENIPALLLYYTPLPHLSFTPCLLRMYRVFGIRTKSQKTFYTHGMLWDGLYVPMHYAAIMHCYYDNRLWSVHCYLRCYHGTPPTRLRRLYVCVKWFLTICPKNAVISLFQH